MSFKQPCQLVNRVAPLFGRPLIHDYDDQIVKLWKRRVEVPAHLSEGKIRVQEIHRIRIKRQVVHGVPQRKSRSRQPRKHHPERRAPTEIHHAD